MEPLARLRNKQLEQWTTSEQSLRLDSRRRQQPAIPERAGSATAWEQNWGSYLKNSPQTISDFVNDLISNPNHMYNGSPDWPISIEGGYWQTNNYGTKGAHTIGTYQSVLNAFSNCGIILPPSQGN